jgi:hypothetical protein
MPFHAGTAETNSLQFDRTASAPAFGSSFCKA